MRTFLIAVSIKNSRSWDISKRHLVVSLTKEITFLCIGSYAVQWFFAGVSVGAAIFVWLLLPETHGKKLSEIEEYFQNNFLAVGAETKRRKQCATRRAQQKTKSPVTEPLNPKNLQNV